MRISTISLLAVLSVVPAHGQRAFEFWPGTNYDPKIPTLRQVLGYEAGDKVTSYAGLVRYMETLSAAVPNRMKVFEYGESWEGRKLIYAAVGSETNLRRLSEIKSAVQRIADPRKTPEADARKLIAGLPA
ncbi:MAG: M14 family zinc carboxypeptidase, partial [Candidatus Solibacter sp.]|nr:M14 family zinc carboxypeptidase [Candidatus Solibacter sp.]